VKSRPALQELSPWGEKGGGHAGGGGRGGGGEKGKGNLNPLSQASERAVRDSFLRNQIGRRMKAKKRREGKKGVEKGGDGQKQNLSEERILSHGVERMLRFLIYQITENKKKKKREKKLEVKAGGIKPNQGQGHWTGFASSNNPTGKQRTEQLLENPRGKKKNPES